MSNVKLLGFAIVPLMLGFVFFAQAVRELLRRTSKQSRLERLAYAFYIFAWSLVYIVIIPLPNSIVRVSTVVMVSLAGVLNVYLAVRGGLSSFWNLAEISLSNRVWGVVGVVLILVLSAVALWPIPSGVNLGLPFQDGVWFVFNGGPLQITNHHMKAPEQKYGLDLVLAQTSFADALSLLERSPIAYPTWDAPVVAPADGTVITAVDGFPDLDVGTRDRHNPAGNYVELLTAEGVRILIAHFKKGSVGVAEGQQVAQGDVLGRVGNSGNTTEPHIHIHAMTETTDGTWVGVPMYFDGRSPRRGHLLRPGN